MCNWIWENLPIIHKDKYLETHNSIVQSVIFQLLNKQIQKCKVHTANIHRCLS